MRLGGCVVLYNPGMEVIDNIGTYLPILDELVAVDNSAEPNEAVEALKTMDGITVLSMSGNRGIAAALNTGCEALAEAGFDVVLTMDQDSRFPLVDADRILMQVKRKRLEYAIVGLNFNAPAKGPDDEVIEVKLWLTSGNFLNLNVFRNVGGFNEGLFIDYVDFEFGHRLYKRGLKLCYLKNFSLKHTIGNPIDIHILGHTYYAMNHAPVRYYYRYRNSSYLYHQDKHFYANSYWHEMVVNFAKMILFEPDKREKLRMISLGLKDAKKFRLGPIPPSSVSRAKQAKKSKE